MKKLLIKNARIPGRSESKLFNVLITDGKIESVIEEDKSSLIKGKEDIKIIDAEGKRVVPGYIDLHIQGAGGSDILDGTEESIEQIAKTSASYGVTRFLATTVYRTDGNNNHLKIASKLTGKNTKGARLEGIHLEGPFISMNKRGMIHPGSINKPSQYILDDILSITNDKLRMMTIAPELKDVEKIIKLLVRENVIVSLGHTEATYEETIRGFDLGINHVTHIYNAMPGLHHRAPGPLIAIYENKKIVSQIITDGVHIKAPVLRFTSDILGMERLAIITDGMRPMGLPDGEYTYEGRKYISKNGTAIYKDGTLVGTTLGFSQLMDRYMEITKGSFSATLKMATEIPAKVLGVDNYSIRLNEGMDADLCILGSGFEPEITIVNGSIVYEKTAV